MGALVSYNDNRYELNEEENVLDCLLRSGQSVPHSCKVGVCQACIMKVVDGDIPARAQNGLKDSYKKQHYFLACQCYPGKDISVVLPSEASLSIKANIIGISYLSNSIMCLRLLPSILFEYQAGQYVTIANSDNVIRSYSISNHLNIDGYIEFHIRLIPTGKMSTWLRDYAKLDDELVLRGPAGNCFYLKEANSDYPIILAGTGTGLAPLYGILVDALEQDHQGEITLYHGTLTVEDLYFIEELKKLADVFDNFHYFPCVLNGEGGLFYRVGNLEDIVMNKVNDHIADARLYLCGAPELVNSIKTKAFIAGVVPSHIFSDAFYPAMENEKVAKERRTTDRK